MKNTCNYSDNWQPYLGDYDKFEYDIILKDGTIVENCYPNGGMFNSMSDLHNNQYFDEKEVVEIRFSQNPKLELNTKYSNAVRSSEQGKRIEEILRQNTFYLQNPYPTPQTKALKGTVVEVRTQPKIGRNQICPQCDSGLKFKRCCGVGKI